MRDSSRLTMYCRKRLRSWIKIVQKNGYYPYGDSIGFGLGGGFVADGQRP